MRGNLEYETRGVLYLIPPEPSDHFLRKIPLDQLFLGMLPGQPIERMMRRQDGVYILSKIEEISDIKGYHIKNVDKVSEFKVKDRELTGKIHSFSKPKLYMLTIGNVPRNFDTKIKKFEYFLEIDPNCQCEFSLINNVCSIPSDFIIKYHLEPEVLELKTYGKTVCKHAIYALKKYFKKDFFYRRYEGMTFDIPFILLDEYLYYKLIGDLATQMRKDNPSNLTEFALSVRTTLERIFNFERFYKVSIRLRELNKEKTKLISRAFLL